MELRCVWSVKVTGWKGTNAEKLEKVYLRFNLERACDKDNLLSRNRARDLSRFVGDII